MYHFYRRLGEARAAAREAGFRGAMFPWQSGSDGKERPKPFISTAVRTVNWDPDHSHNQRHVNAAIFYNIWSYYGAAQDLTFLRGYGAEMMLEVARPTGLDHHFNPERDRYRIHGVMGPDEFEGKYPGAERAACAATPTTNVMVAWAVRPPGRCSASLRAAAGLLRARLELTDERSPPWQRMEPQDIRFRSTGRHVSQFEATRTSENSTGTPTATSTTMSSGWIGSYAPRATTPTATS